MNKIRLMIITHDLAIGGLQQVIVNICRSINRQLFNVSVLCLRGLGEFTSELYHMGIKVFFLHQPKNHTDYFSFFKVANILRKEKVNVIHTHNTQPFIDGTLGVLLSGRKIRIVHTDHARNFPDKKRYMFAEWMMSLFAYKIVGVSAHTTKNLFKYEKISPKKLITIPNGIDCSKYNVTIDKAKKREELGILQEGLVIGLGVRLSNQKGITYLLKAMPNILRHFPNISLVIAGQGELEDQLKKEAKEIGINRNVLFIGPRLDMHEVLKLFDLYVLPSLWEGLPMVILEAMAAGCPIVATDVGGNNTAIQNGYNGSLVKPRDPDALAAEVIRLLSDEKIRKIFSVNGKKIFMQKYHSDIMTRNYELLYQGKCR